MTCIQLKTEQADIALPLQSKMLRLRAPDMADVHRMTEYLNDFEVAGNLARVPHPYHLEHAQKWIETAPHRPDRSIFAIEHTDHGFVGNVGFRHSGGAATIGYWLGRPFWNQGIMTEAMITALKWYFTITRSDVVLSGIFHFNMGSLAIQQKLGFVETGRSVTRCLARGKDVEHIDTELTRDAFELTIDSYDDTAARNAKSVF